MSSLSAPPWRCVGLDDLAWREWHGEWVVRNERSGSTHLLGPLAAEILRELLAAPEGLSSAELRAALARSQAGPPIDAVAIEEVLSEFRRLGLAVPATS